MIHSDDVRCHSSDVRLSLIVGENILSLSSVGGERASLVSKGFQHNPTEAEIVVEIDGHPQRSRIYLMNGVDPESHEIAFEYIHYAK